VLVTALAGGAILIGATGPVPILYAASDVAIYLDACYNVSKHLVLGRDFFSPIGPSALLPTALAMRLGGATVGALAYGAILAWLGYGTVAWLTARSRMNHWLAVGFALFAAATASAPYSLDFGSWRALSYSLLYNRMAWTAICIAAVPAFLPAEKQLNQREWTLFGYGACAALLALNKPNYLLMLAPLTLWILGPEVGTWRKLLAKLGGFISGAILAATVIWLCVPYDPIGIFRETFEMGRGAPVDLLYYTLKRSLLENWVPFGCLACCWIAFVALSSKGKVRRVAWKSFLLFLAVSTCVFLANTTNCQFKEFPVFGAFGWILAAICMRGWKRGRGIAVLAAVGVAMGVAFAWQPWISFPYSFVAKYLRPPRTGDALAVNSYRWAGMPMQHFPTEESDASFDSDKSAADYANWLNDGLALLSRFRPQQCRVLSLDWSNPFPFALGLDPLIGEQVAWHVGRTLGPLHHPDMGHLLAQAGVVMEPKRPGQPLSTGLKRALILERLNADFRVMGESACWRIWVRVSTQH
jgi:hypothetical protein